MLERAGPDEMDDRRVDGMAEVGVGTGRHEYAGGRIRGDARLRRPKAIRAATISANIAAWIADHPRMLREQRTLEEQTRRSRPPSRRTPQSTTRAARTKTIAAASPGPRGARGAPACSTRRARRRRVATPSARTPPDPSAGRRRACPAARRWPPARRASRRDPSGREHRPCRNTTRSTPAPRAKRKPDRKLPPPFATDHAIIAVDADDGQRDGQRAEGGHQRREEPRPRERTRKMLVHRLHVRERHGGIEFGHRAADGRHRRARIAIRPHDERHERKRSLRGRLIHLGTRRRRGPR